MGGRRGAWGAVTESGLVRGAVGRVAHRRRWPETTPTANERGAISARSCSMTAWSRRCSSAWSRR